MKQKQTSSFFNLDKSSFFTNNVYVFWRFCREQTIHISTIVLKLVTCIVFWNKQNVLYRISKYVMYKITNTNISNGH